MQALINPSLQLETLFSKKNGQEFIRVNDDKSMTNKHSCPCCSYKLLRHIRLEGIYWRCSHCFQEMPAY